MANGRVSLLACLVLFALVAPTLAVNRLFVDKISGYHQELVTSQDIDTDLLRTTLMVVGTGVDMNSLDDHVIDTVGSIALDGTELDFTATNSIDIASFGGNVRFAADSVGVSAAQGGVISSTEATIHANDLSLTYGTFDVDGADTTIRSLGDIDFNGTTLDMDAADRVGIIASIIDMNFGGDFSASSDQSNLRVDAGKEAAFSTSQSMSITGQSGVDVISFHDELALSSDLGDAQFSGENAEIRGLHRIGLNADGDATYSAERIETNSDSIQFVAADDIAFVAGETITLAANGHALASGASLTVSGQDTNVNSAGDLVLLSANDIDGQAGNDITGSAALFHVQAGNDVDTSASSQINLTSGYQFNVDSLDDDIIFTASSAGLSMDAADNVGLYSAAGTFTLAADEFVVGYDSSAEFTAENNLGFFVDGAISLQTVEVNAVSFNSLQVQGTDEALFSAGDNLSVSSARHIDFVAQNGDIELDASGEIDFAVATTVEMSSDFLDIFASGDFELSSEGDFDISADAAINFDATQFLELSSRFLVVGSDTGSLTFNAQLIDLETRVSNEFSSGGDMSLVSQSGVVIDAFLVDISSDAGEVDISHDSEIIILGEGGQLFSSTDNDFSATNYFIFADDVFSVFQETDVTASSISFEGDFDFSAALDRDGTITIDGTASFTFANDGLFQGGQIDIDIESTFDWNALTILIQSGNGQDIIHDAGAITMQGTDLSADMPYIIYRAGSVEIVGGDTTFAAPLGSIVVSTEESTTLETLAGDFTAEATAPFSTGLISGSSSVTLQALSSMTQVFGGSFVQNASESISYLATADFSMEFVPDSTIVVTTGTQASYETTAGSTVVSTTEDQLFDGTDTDVSAQDMTANGDEVNYVSRGLVRFDAGTDFTVSATNHNVFGGDIVIDATSDLVYNVDTLSFGAVEPSEANPSDGTVTVDAGDDNTFVFGELVEMSARGNNPYVDEAITMLAEAGTINFLANNAASTSGIEFNGNNGVNITTSTANVLSHQGVLFHARTGSFIAEAFGDDPDVLTLSTFDHDALNPGFSVRAASDLASVVTHAADDIDVISGNFVFSGASGVSVVNYDAAAMTHLADNGDLTKTAGGNFIATAGAQFSATSEDATFDIGGDLYIHSLFDDAGPNSEGIVFDSRSGAPSLGTDIDVVGGFYGYPSGVQEITVTDAAASLFITSGTQDFGGIKFGSKTGSYLLDTRDSLGTFLANAGHWSAVGGGVDGHVTYEAGSDSTITVGRDYTVNSAANSQYIHDGLTIQATTDATFSSDSETEGISQVGDSITFDSQLPAGATNGITIEGHYVVMRGDDTVFSALEWTIGENNQQHNPVVLVNAADWEQATVGTVQYTVANNEFGLTATDIALSSQAGNVLLTSGGDQIYQTTWASGVPSEGLLSIEAENGQVSVTADNTIELDTGSGTQTADTINIISQGNSPSSNIVMQTNSNIEFFEIVNMDVQTNAHFVAGAIDFNADDLTITSSAGTFDIDSDHDLDIISQASDVTLTTAANNAHIEVQSLGVNSDITMTAGADVVLTAASDAEFSGDSTIFNGVSSLTLSATSTNNGKFQFDASGEIRVSGGPVVSVIGGDDVYFDAIGEDSTFEMDIGQSFAVFAVEELHFDNNPGEGGSVIFRMEQAPYTDDGQTPSTVIAANLNVDMDGDFLVQTQGVFDFNGREFDITIGGYTDLRATDFSVTALDDILLEANAGSIRYAASGPVPQSADVFDVVAADGFTAHLQGNRTDAFLFVTGDTMNFDSENSVLFSAYDLVGVRAPVVDLRAVNSIDVETTHVAGDIIFFAPRMEIDAENILVNVTGAAGASNRQTRGVSQQNSRDSVGGSIRIENEPLFDYYDSFLGVIYWNEYSEYEYIPQNLQQQQTRSAESGAKEAFLERVRASVPLAERDYWVYGADFSADSVNIFKGAEELSVNSEQGDVRFEYAQNLLLASNQITGFTTGGIEVHAYGEGRRTVGERDDVAFDIPKEEAIIFGDLTSLNFRTNNAGSGEINVVAEQGSVFVTTGSSTTLRAGNDNLYISSASNLAILNTRGILNGNGRSGEIDFDSAGDLSIQAFDDDINVFGTSVTFGALANGVMSFNTGNGLDGTFNIQVSSAVAGTIAGDLNFSSSAADVRFTAEFDIIFSAEVVSINHANDAYFEYGRSLSVTADIISLDALSTTSYDGAYHSEDSGIVRFDGRTADYHTGSDQFSVFRPTVFFSDQLALLFDNSAAFIAVAGGFCEFDRAISFEESEFVDGVHSFCICVDHTWQCRRDNTNYSVAYDWAPNPYAPDTYYPNG